MLSLVSAKTLQGLGLSDVTSPVFTVTITFTNSVPQVTMVPQDDKGVFCKKIIQAVCVNTVPVGGVFIFQICATEKIRILADDEKMGRLLLNRFKGLMQEPMDVFEQMIQMLPKREDIEEWLKSSMLDGMQLAHRMKVKFEFKGSALCCECGQPSKESFSQQESVHLETGFMLMGMSHAHPFFSVFSELVSEAIGNLVLEHKQEVLLEFLAGLQRSRTPEGLELLN